MSASPSRSSRASRARTCRACASSPAPTTCAICSSCATSASRWSSARPGSLRSSSARPRSPCRPRIRNAPSARLARSPSTITWCRRSSTPCTRVPRTPTSPCRTSCAISSSARSPRTRPKLGVNSRHERPRERRPAACQARGRGPGQRSLRRARREDLHQSFRAGLRHALGHRAKEARSQGARRLLLQARRCFRAGEQRDAAPARRDRGDQQGLGEARRRRPVERLPVHEKVLTFVLVHGAWGGSWMWARLAPLLRAAGHDVFAPSLTGTGERAHLASPAIDLSTHIADVLGTLQYERLQELVLVAHSYGGMV